MDRRSPARTCIVAVPMLAILCLATSVSAQCPSPLVGAADTERVARGVVVVDGLAYVATGSFNFGDFGPHVRLDVIDISDPLSPEHVGWSPSSAGGGQGAAFDVVVASEVAYLAGENLHLIDVSDPTNPAILGVLETSGITLGVAVEADVAYVADGASGLHVVDVSDPVDPSIIGSVDTPGNAGDVVVSGGVAFVADGSCGLQVVDVSDPASPAIVGSVDTPGDAGGVVVRDDVVYLADGSSGLQVIDVSDPASPAILGAVSTPSPAIRVVVREDQAYVVDSVGLRVIDISDPANPSIFPGFITAPGIALGVDVVSGVAYVAMGGFGSHETGPRGRLQVIDVSDPVNPFLGAVGIKNVADVAVDDNVAYVAAETYGLQVIDVSNSATPRILGTVDTPDASGVVVSGNVAYVADRRSGLQVIDVSDPHTPTILATAGKVAWDVATSDGVAYVVDNDNLVQIIDVSDPRSPAVIGSVEPSTNSWYTARYIAVSGDVLLVAMSGGYGDAQGRCVAIGVADPTNPVVKGSVSTPSGPTGVFIAGDVGYTTDFLWGLQILDISDLADPVIVGAVPISSGGGSLVVADDVAYVASHGLQVIDVSNSTRPEIIGSMVFPSGNGGFAVCGDQAFVGSNIAFGIMNVVDISSCTVLKNCGADLSGDRAIGFEDLLVLLNRWGSCGPPCVADIHGGDGWVGFGDLLMLLNAWGPC